TTCRRGRGRSAGRTRRAGTYTATKLVNDGSLPFDEPGAEPVLREVLDAGRFVATTDPAVVATADTVIVVIGTPVDEHLNPDPNSLPRALSACFEHFRDGQLVVLRSTVYPGVTALIERKFAEGGVDVDVAFCPERILEGHAMEELYSLPQIIGTRTESAKARATELFGVLADKLVYTGPEEAELAKLFTNVYRYVNFALANEFAILGEHYRVDSHRIIEMVNQDYPRASVPRPGPAGGPCLSKDGYFLVEELTLPDFVLLAWKLNDSAPAHVVRRLARRLAARDVPLAGTPIAVLGQAFKRDSDDPRQSPAVRITEILEREGAEVRVHDPFLPGATLEQALTGARAFVLATNHSHYDRLDPADLAALLEEPRMGVDCWGVLNREAFAAAGVEVATFGVGEEL
ncbi:MAG TPA: nucleotide sugar dehydrogenase, partial [Actinomycetota bacterium]|nr:nucleotide sugar dehydrogenase [Actinomycetota bacterium]